MNWLLVWAILLVLGVVIAWATNVVSLPGNWIALVLMVLYAWFIPRDQGWVIGLPTLIAAAALAGLGEIVEFLAAAAGAKKAGGGWRSSLGAIVGSIVGAIVGVFVGVPIPVLGSIIGAILFAAVGAMAGAMLGEWTTGKAWRDTVPVGKAAFSGRLVGTVGKMLCGAGMILVVIVGLIG